MGSQSASATDCANRDLRSASHFGTPRNQGATGWCFAYAAADLYSHALKKRVSPIDIALNYYRDNTGYGVDKVPMLTEWRGGRQDWVYSSVTKWGICPDNKISAYKDGSARDLRDIERLISHMSLITGPNRRHEITLLTNKNFRLLNKIFPMSTAGQLRDAILNLDRRELPLIAMADQICGDERVDVSHLKRYGDAYPFSRPPSRTINAELSMGNPVAISYNTISLRDPTKSGPLNHISTIIASRRRGQSCEYLLRNSWGAFNPKTHHPSLAANGEDGYVWLPEKMINVMARGIDVIR